MQIPPEVTQLLDFNIPTGWSAVDDAIHHTLAAVALALKCGGIDTIVILDVLSTTLDAIANNFDDDVSPPATDRAIDIPCYDPNIDDDLDGHFGDDC